MKDTNVKHPHGVAGGAQEGQAAETTTSPQLANGNKPQEPHAYGGFKKGCVAPKAKAIRSGVTW